jgi:hypothetical protein
VRRFIKVFVMVALGAASFSQMAVATDAPAATGRTDWGGIGWGIGISADFDPGGRRIVGTPTIVGTPGIVRVDNTSSNVNVGFVLEAHYFFKEWVVPAIGPGRVCDPAMVARKQSYAFYNCTDIATGPFVAIEIGNGSKSTPASDGLISGYALGWMVGFRHLDFDANGNLKNKDDRSSWNFGIGLRVTPGAQVLGDGFVANAPPPAGETTVRVKTEPRYGIMLLSSFSF